MQCVQEIAVLTVTVSFCLSFRADEAREEPAFSSVATEQQVSHRAKAGSE